MLFHLKDNDRVKLLNTVEGLSDIVLKYYPKSIGKHKALLMEFVLYGLSAYSLISKKILSEKVEFKDLMSSMFSGEEG
jgi:magnesium chelatase subunit I